LDLTVVAMILLALEEHKVQSNTKGSSSSIIAIDIVIAITVAWPASIIN
jgi:hypothetical protein